MLEEIIETVVVLNIFLAIMVVIEDLYFYYKVKEDSRWSKILYASVGFAWFIRYVLFYLNFHPFDLADVNVPVLLLTTFTLLAMSVGANIRIKRDIKTEEILNDIRKVFKWTSKKS